MRIPETIKEEYRKRTERDRRELAERTASVRAKAPEIDEIEAEKVRIAYTHSTHAFSSFGDTYLDEHDDVCRQIEELTQRKAQILSRLGLPEDYLSMRYVCDKCADTGLLSDGTPCSCLREMLMRYYYDSAALDERETFATYDLSVFKDEKQRARMKKVRQIAEGYAESLPRPEKLNMILLGTTGLGKSFTLNCIAHRAFERGIDVVRITSYNMFDSILSAIRKEREMPDYTSCGLLAIDDLGTEPIIRNVTVEHLFTIINEREARRLPTVIASNLSPADFFDRYGDRVASRILSDRFGTVIKLYGDDVRLN